MDNEAIVLVDALRRCRYVATAGKSDSLAQVFELELNSALPSIFKSICERFSTAFPDWTIHEMPGYLRREIGSSVVCVPFHLLPDFPDQAILLDIRKLSQHIALSPNAAICLSGSMTAIRVYREVADLDFCEYVHDSRQLSSQRIADVVVQTNDDFICTRLKVGHELIIERAWCSTAARVLDIERARSGHAWAKVDAIGYGPDIGVLEVTNVVLFGGGSDSEAFARSFPAQEALLNGASWVPMKLASAHQLGLYIDFLLLEIESHLRASPPKIPKAAKRLFSLLTLMRRVGDVDELVGALNDCEATALAAISARKSLLPRLLEIAEQRPDFKLKALCEETTERLTKKYVSSLPPAPTDSAPVTEESYPRPQAQLASVVERLFTKVAAMLAPLSPLGAS